MKREVRRTAGYEEAFPGEIVCIYCGVPKEVLDHALPYSKREFPQAGERVLVPACHECNAILKDSLQHTLSDRIKVAKIKLANRYAKVLRTPSWGLEELMELSENLRMQIMHNISLKRFVEDRLAFDYFLWIDLYRPEDLLPIIK
jgi:hypothetical protein